MGAVIKIYFEIFAIGLVSALGAGAAFLLSTPPGAEYDWIRAGINATVTFSTTIGAAIAYYRREKK